LSKFIFGWTVGLVIDRPVDPLAGVTLSADRLLHHPRQDIDRSLDFYVDKLRTTTIWHLPTARRAVFSGLSEGQLGNFERLANFHQKPLSKPDKPLASHGRQTVRFPTV